MPDKNNKKKPYQPPEIKAIVYDPKEKVTAYVNCKTSGSGAPESAGCMSIYCELP
jgi:hypothetical protein